ncbi:MAG: Ig-like domain-containing protein, partial [Paludibacteraceae bacterium]
MKANKIFAIALAALAFVACKPTNEEVTPLELSQNSATIKVGETLTLTANVKVDSWESQNPAVATVNDGVVLGVSVGTTIISATAGSDSKTCVVKVDADNGGGNQGGGTAELKCS